MQALIRAGAPPEQLASIRTEPPPPLWPCNEPAFAVFMRLPWLPGAMGSLHGLDWASLPRIGRELRIKRRDQQDLPALLRLCESTTLAWRAEQQRLAEQQPSAHRH